MAAAKRVLRYLCSTSGMGLVLGGRRPVVLTGHADASWADDQATQRSSQGYTFSLGCGSVSWRSTRSSSVLSSSCEAEIYAGAMAAQELRWLTYLLTDLGEQPRSPPVLYVDNKAMLAWCREHRLEHRTKHIALRYFLARELQQLGQLRLAYVASEANTADIFTKALAPGDHQRFCTLLGFPTCTQLFHSSFIPVSSQVYDPDAEERIHNRFNNELNSPIPPEVYANLAHTIAGPNTRYLDSCCGQHMCSSETRFIVNQRRLENHVVVTVANNQRLTAHWMGSIVLDSVEEDFSLHLNEVLLVPRLGFNLMSCAQLMKNGITLLGEPGKFTLKYGDKKLGTAVEQNGVFVLIFIPERTTADSDNILSLGPWEHRDDINYSDGTVPREGVVPTSSTTAAAIMLTFDDQGLNDVENSRENMAAVAGWSDTTNMPTDDGVWGADAPDETTWGETPAECTTRLLTEAEQRVAEIEILDSGRLVGVEPVPAASDQESGELVLAPGEYVDVEVRVPPPNLTRYVAHAFDQIRSDGHQLLLSFFANAEYYLRAQGHKATGETWHKRLGHPSQSTLNNTIKAALLDKDSLLLPNGLELKPVNRPAPCTICPAANLLHEPFPTHFPGAEDYQLMDKVYSGILNLPGDGFNGERYVITFTDASTRYWGLHLGIEKQYFAWRIMDYRNRLLVPARDCIFYENLTLPIFEQHLASQQNPATSFHGVRSFANADVELAASEEPDSDGAREAAPDPPVPVTSFAIPEFVPLADAAPEDVRDVHQTYLVDEQRQPMPVVSDSSIRVNIHEIEGGKWRSE
ncbi:unnamed protein product [Closterium sp. NIES-54]